MKIINNTSFAIFVYIWHRDRGCMRRGEDIRIETENFKEIAGPYFGEVGKRDPYLKISEGVTCQEGPDDGNGFQILRGHQLTLGAEAGVTIRHHLEKRAEI